jgi:hypothetical protein
MAIVAALAVALNLLAIDPAEADAIAARLAGQRFTIAADRASLAIDDVAGLGAPVIGVIERRGNALVLLAADGAHALTGPLARPRIAGPGYTVWVIGAPAADGSIRAARLGVLRRPRSLAP